MEANGGIAVLASGREQMAEALARRVDGLLLSGGCDVAPERFGQENRGSGEADGRRDAFELALCRAMIRLDKPVLGICRGICLLYTSQLPRLETHYMAGGNVDRVVNALIASQGAGIRCV